MIILTKPDDTDFFEHYTTLTKLCKDKPWAKYNYLKRLKFPFYYKGYKFIRIKR
jgi:hypothetical protein